MILNAMSRHGVNVRVFKQNSEFLSFLERVELVFKENSLLKLKNLTRRRRILAKYLSDFNILVAEADYI